MKKNLFAAVLATTCLFVSGCNSYGTDNAPTPTALTQIDTKLNVQQLWSASSGAGVGKQYLKLPAAYENNRIFAADYKGVISAFNAETGKSAWRTVTKLPITAGPAAYAGLVIVGTSDAKVAAFNQDTGVKVWEADAPSEILATPATFKDTLIIKTIDGQITALDVATGELQWHYQEDLPSLILRGSSSVTFNNDALIAGFSNGKISAIDIDSGSLLWQTPIASPEGSNIIDNMVDIDATPIVKDGVVYAASYQGNVASLDMNNGQTNWQRAISTFSGIAANNDRVFVSEADGSILAFNQKAGAADWKQDALLYRNISGPAIYNDNTLVVGDKEGYLHFLSTDDGSLVARIKASRKSVLATPLVVNNTLYVTTTNGYVIAYRTS